MNGEIQATYKAADDVLTLMMIASAYATQAHELTFLVRCFDVVKDGDVLLDVERDDPQDVKNDGLQARARLAQRLVDLKRLDGDIRGVKEHLGERWQRLQPVRRVAYDDARPYVVGEMLTAIIPGVRQWISETCGWLALGDDGANVLSLHPESVRGQECRRLA